MADLTTPISPALSETPRPPHIRWLATIERIVYDEQDWIPESVVTYFPGWIDVRAYPELAEFSTLRP